ncbi:hypothetical protein [Aeromonas veronii]|uniref:hypothetical protein n=1 Tax=Aeromonas veronii TaxID=654 RepID=UPI003D1F083F
MMNPVPWLQMTNMISHPGLVRTFPNNFPGRETVEGRYGFVGHEASEVIKAMYVGKRLPDEFRKRGASNPIKYTWS